MFARARETGHVYVAAFLPGHPKDSFLQWSRVQPAGEVEQIVGAAPHTTPGGKRYIVLFVIAENAGERTLDNLRFDLDDLVWSKRRPLDLPHGITRGFRVAAIQKRPNAYASGLDEFSPGSDCPTVVAVEDSNDILYVRRLDSEAQGWRARAGCRSTASGSSQPRSSTIRSSLLVSCSATTRNTSSSSRNSSAAASSTTLFSSTRQGGRSALAQDRGSRTLPRRPRHAAVAANRGLLEPGRIHAIPDGSAGRKPRRPGGLLALGGIDADIDDQVDTNNIVSQLLGRDTKLIQFIVDFDKKWLQTRAGVSLDDIDLNGIAVPLFIRSRRPPEARTGTRSIPSTREFSNPSSTPRMSSRARSSMS